jgi:hypothetical protein
LTSKYPPGPAAVGLEPGQPQQARETDKPTAIKRWDLLLGVLFWVAVGVGVAVANESVRAWILRQWLWIVVVALLLSAILLRGWIKRRDISLRAGVFLLIVLPLVGLGAASVFFWMPTAGQLITLRSVVLVVLIVTPALMWWLFWPRHERVC